jgi:hypothetical protein
MTRPRSQSIAISRVGALAAAGTAAGAGALDLAIGSTETA